MAESLTLTASADDIAAAVFNHLVNDPSGGLSAKVKAEVEGLLGPLPAASDAERRTIHEQVEAIVKAKVDEMGIEESLADMREAMATKQPERVEQAKSLDELLQHGDRHNPNAVGAELDGRFEGFNGFIRAVATQNKQFTEQRDPRLTMIGETPIVKAALTGEEIELGGALVPEEFRAQLMMAQLEPTSIRPRATVLPMSSHTISVPAIRDESHSGGTVFGGVHFQWLESGDDMDESEPDFSQIRLTAKLLTGRTDVNNTMLADSFASVPMLLGRMWPAAHRWTEELAFMRGSGAGEPLGIKNANCLVDSGDTLSGNVDPGALAKMLSHLLPESYGTACWHAHPALLPDFVQLRVGQHARLRHRPDPADPDDAVRHAAGADRALRRQRHRRRPVPLRLALLHHRRPPGDDHGRLRARSSSPAEPHGLPLRLTARRSALDGHRHHPARRLPHRLAVRGPLGAPMANFASLEDWTRAVIRAQSGGVVDEALQRATSDGAVKAVLTGEEINLGGALIPEELAPTLFVPPTTHSSLWSMCTQWQMGTSIRRVPAVYDKTHAAGAAPYGVKFKWRRDGTDRSSDQSPIKLQQIRLDASGTVEAYFVTATSLVEDSAGAFADIFRMLFSQGLEWEMERVILRGLGAEEPLGVINANATLAVGRATASQITRPDIAEMLSRLLPACYGRSVWLFNPDAAEEIVDIDDSIASQDGDGFTIAGRRAYPSEHCSALGSSGDLILMDPSAYFIGNRQMLDVQMSQHAGFPNYETHVRATARIAGQPGIVTPITPAQGTDTLSAFVSL